MSARAARVIVLAIALGSAACAHGALPLVLPQTIRHEGLGAYGLERVLGERGPSNAHGKPARPKVIDGLDAVPATNDWWSSLLWPFDGEAYSKPMFAHPLAMKAEAGGLAIGYPTEVVLGARNYRYPYVRDLVISMTSLHAPDARVASWSDWAVTAAWQDGERALRATFGHGLPFVYARVAHGEARVELAEDPASEPRVWSDRGEVIGVTVRGHAYALFAPTGATWRREGSAFVSTLAGRDFFSVAALPDASPETLALFRKHAYAFVTDTHVTWRFDRERAAVVSHFEATTTLMEAASGRAATPLLALYPHQWKSTKAPLTSLAYVSPRGAMRLLEGGSFDVERAFHGVLPVLPDAGTYDRRDLARLVRDAAGEGDLFPPGPSGLKNTYWTGKSLVKVASLVWLADQLGEAETRDRLVSALERELADSFDGKPPSRFAYDAAWGTLIGYPAGYESDTELNDHHLHYGYFIWAAATVAAHDPAWGKAERYGAIVNLLVKDAANEDGRDARFPRLRAFDPYAGHSWANGPAKFEEGNNEESLSEDVHFASALVLWGSVTGDDAIRDLGAFLYETTISAAEQYWLDDDHDVFPKGYRHPVAGILWGDGVTYDTWWERNPIYVHGINILPVTGASLYLGRRPAEVRARYAHLLQENRGPLHQWRDILWMYLALDDAKSASAMLDDDHAFDPEGGNSWANTFHFIKNMCALGHVDTSVRANAVSYAVFRSGERRTYAAYNPSAAPITVRFTDGASLDLPPHAMRHAARAVR